MLNRYPFPLPIVFCFIAMAVWWPASHAAAGEHVTNRVIVKFKSGSAQPAGIDRLNVRNLRSGSNLTLHHVRTLANNSRVYSLGKFRKLADAKAVAAELMQRDDVEYAEPDVRRFPQFEPNDNEYPNQWYLYESDGGIRAREAWDTTRGDGNTVIAVIDSGILPHSDLVRVLDHGYDFISGDPTDPLGLYFTANDGDGRDPDPADPGDAVGENECDDGEPAESSWHGTLVTGILVAETDNNSGISGIDHQAFVLPVRALGRCGGFISDIADAIRWAAGLPVPGVPDNPTPADVINLSLGATESTCSSTEREAINAAVANNAVVVVAAGNEGGFIENSAPANCDNVIVVTASTRDGGETCYTNVGEGADIAAPGGNSQEQITLGGVPATCTALAGDRILSTSNNGTNTPDTETYRFVAGTSFSAPMVSGAVALMKSVDNSLTPGSIETILKNTARVFPTNTADAARDCVPENCGAGILDVQGAVAAAGDGGFDSTPNPFEFTAQTGVAPNTTVESDSATITGIDVPTTVSVSGGAYSIENSAYTEADGVITAGQSIRLRVISSPSFSSTTRATLTIGGVNAEFSVGTRSNGGGGGGGGSLSWAVLSGVLLLLKIRLYRNRADSL